jgi:NADPH:quinone reductase-like Zn-dependent oxidoreductase
MFNPEKINFLQKKGDKKMIDVKQNKFKKQLGELMSGSAGFVSDYEDSKTLDEAKAAEVINKYNNREK